MKSPTPKQVFEAREKAGLSQSTAAELIHLNSGRAWRQYESGDRTMHPAFWELFLIKTGQLDAKFSHRGS